MPTQTKTPQPSHHVRTILASILGAVGVWLIIASILVVWLNRTVTDTTTFTKTVTPLVTKPEIQDFFIDKVSDQLLNNAPINELAPMLMSAEQVSGKTEAQLRTALEPVIHENIHIIVSSPAFAVLWERNVNTAHKQLVTQIKNNDPNLTLDFSPTINQVIADFKGTQLAPIADKIEIKPDTGKLDLGGVGVDKAHRAYVIFQRGTILTVLLAIAAIVGAVLLSVHHTKTARRIAISVGVFALFLAFSIQVPVFAKFSTDPAQREATVTVVRVLFHNLQLACLIIGVLCIGGAIGSKIYDKKHSH